MTANNAEYVVLETAVQSHIRNHVGAVFVDHIFISPVIQRAFIVLLLISSQTPKEISSTVHVPPHSLPRIFQSETVNPLDVIAHGAT